MGELAEDDLNDPPSRFRNLWITLGGLAALALVVAIGWGLKSMLGGDTAPQRQVAKITVLPDQPPPPPPPPPKEEPKPEPRDTNKPPPPDLAPKPQQAPPQANEPLKMEGPAGDGASPFAAGNVAKDYLGGAPTVGGAPAGRASAPLVDRAQERLYASTVRNLLREAIERHLKADANQLSAEFTLWLEPDGSIRRFALQPSGDAAHDEALQAALDDTRKGLRLPAPPSTMAPMRFRLSVRPQG